MSNPLQPSGAKFVDATAVTGQLILTREDGSTAPAPILIFTGAELVDNGDGTCRLIALEG